MNYLIFHFSNPYINKEKGIKKIWFPLNPDINIVLEYIRKHQNGPVAFWLESCFKPYITNHQDVYYFNKDHTFQPSKKKIILYAQSDTLAHSSWLIGEKFEKEKAEVIYTIPPFKKEKSDVFFTSKGITYHILSYKLIKKFRADALIMFNDWSKLPHWVIAVCRLYKIPVICIQESVTDFGDKFKRMQWADNVFIQGTQTIFDLPRDTYYLTGNPRYEPLTLIPSHGKKNILINCNFTYGIFEEVRDSWLSDVVSCIEELQIPYFISQHPRDSGDISKYKHVIKSSSVQVAEQLSKTKVLVTRFSSLIHEALIAGINVVYYNPHGEQMGYNFQFNDEFLILATNKSELKNAIAKAYEFSDRGKIENYLINHCIQKSSKPTENIEKLLLYQTFESRKFSFSDAWKLILYHPFLLRLIWFLKKR
jgi:hypothetical protein